MNRFNRCWLMLLATAVVASAANSARAEAPGAAGAADAFFDRVKFPGVRQTLLVANRPEFGAAMVDPLLINPWGIAIRPAGLGGHFWLPANGTGQSIEYVGDVGATPLFQDELKTVDMAGAGTGVVFNAGKGFVISQPHADGPIMNPAKFIFANASGTLTAWTERQRADGGFDRPLDSVTVVDGRFRHSSFLGIGLSPDNQRLYAADFGAVAEVRVYTSGFVEQAPLANPFREGGVAQPGGFEAFNVQTIATPERPRTFVMYGRHVAPDPTQPLPPGGKLAEFDEHGALVGVWRDRGYLHYPWGIAMAPKDFGLYSGCLLVGNFGDGTVVAFHPRWRIALDYVRDDKGERVKIDGLWGLQFGNGESLGESNDLYFAAGPNREKDGLFGKLEAVSLAKHHGRQLSLCR